MRRSERPRRELTLAAGYWRTNNKGIEKASVLAAGQASLGEAGRERGQS